MSTILGFLPNVLKFSSEKATERPGVANALAALAFAYFGIEPSAAASVLHKIADFIGG